MQCQLFLQTTICYFSIPRKIANAFSRYYHHNSRMQRFVSVHETSRTPPFDLHTLQFSLLSLLNDKEGSSDEPIIHKFIVYQDDNLINQVRKRISIPKSGIQTWIFFLTKNYQLIRASLHYISNSEHLNSVQNSNASVDPTFHDGLNSDFDSNLESPPLDNNYVLKLENLLKIPMPKGRFSSLLTKKQMKLGTMIIQSTQNRLIILVDKILYCISLDLAFEIRRVECAEKIEMIALNKQNEDEVICIVPHGRLKFIKILPQVPGESVHNCVDVREELTIPYIYYQHPTKMEPILNMKMFNNYIAIKFSSYYIIIDATSGKTLVNSLRHDNDKTQDFSPWPRLLEDGSGMFTHFCPIVGSDNYIFLTDEKRKGPNWSNSICCDFASPFVVNCNLNGVHFYGTYWDEVVYSKMDFKHTIDMCIFDNKIFIVNKTKQEHSLLIGHPISLSLQKKRLIFSPRHLFKEALELHNQDFDNQIEELLMDHECALEEIDSQHNKMITKLNLQLEEHEISKEEFEAEQKNTQTQFELKAKEEKQQNRKRVQLLEKVGVCEERQLYVYSGLSLIKKKDFHSAFIKFHRTRFDVRYFTPFLALFKIPLYIATDETAQYQNPVYKGEILNQNIVVDSGYFHSFAEELLSYLYHVQLQFEEDLDVILEEKYYDALYFSGKLQQGIDDHEIKKLIQEQVNYEREDIKTLISAITSDLENFKPIEVAPDLESLMKKVVSLQVENRDLKDLVEQMKEQMIHLRQENKFLHQTVKKFSHQHSMSATDVTSQWTYDDVSFHSEDIRDDQNDDKS